ncbi:serine hydrolase domain-containing protein [Segniliparus rotundus]|nr:serine hydrolase domain-containing protein [Segniliparus rotundus]
MVTVMSAPDAQQGLPEGVQGTADRHFDPVVKAFAKLYTGRRAGGGALTVRLHGETVLDIWAGHSDRAGRAAWTRDTAPIVFSVSKGLSSTIIHRLADRGLIEYDKPVAEYWPAFGKSGKHAVTVRKVMAHEAGLSQLGGIINEYADYFDHELIEDRLASAWADRFAGKPAYHAFTYGWILSGLARAVTGKGMRDLFRQELAEPLGVEHIHLGRPPESSPTQLAAFVGARIPSTSPAQQVIQFGRKWTPFKRLIEACIPEPGMEKILHGDHPPILDGEMPAASVVVTAPVLATVYAALAGGGSVDGTQLLQPETVRQLSARRDPRNRATYQPDRVLGVPMMWHLGYHSLLTPVTLTGFGHIGIGGSAGWADPSNGIAVGYVHNRTPVTMLTDQASFPLLWPLILRAAKRRDASGR